MTKQEKIEKLVAWLERQDYRYHTLNKPRYSDEKYDAKKDELRELAPKHKYLNKVGAPIAPGRVKVKFTEFVVGSLEKLRPSNAPDWINKLRAELKTSTFLIWPKLDGISLTLHYIDGVLQSAFKRGEGNEGEDCIIQAKYIQGVPHKLKFSKTFDFSGDLYIRGEVICHVSIFKEKFSKAVGGKYSTIRNFCGGILNTLPNKKTNKLKEETIEALASMTFVVFALSHKRKKVKINYSYRSQELSALSDWGFTTIRNPSRYNDKANKWFNSAKRGNVDGSRFVPVIGYENTVKDWVLPYDLKKVSPEYFKMKIEQYTNDLDIEQDGLVIEAADDDSRFKLGFMPNGMTPKFMMAVKPERKDQLTLSGRVGEIKLSFTARRIYTPIIILKSPLDFQGVKVSRITGHNVGSLVKVGVDIGSKVDIVRSGKVIPYFSGLSKGQLPKQPSWLIKECVYCKTKLKWTREEGTNEKKALYCPNEQCPGFGFETLDRFFDKIKINGLGRGVLLNLAKRGIDTVPKVLRVDAKQLAKVEGFAVKRAENLLLGIKKVTQSADLATIAGASGIFSNQKHGLDKDLIGPIIEKLGKARFLQVKDANVLRNALIGVPNMGVARTELFIEKLPEFQKFYAEISDLITLKASEKLVSTKLAGKTFVFTEWRDETLSDLIKSNGGKVTTSVSGKTTAVLHGPPGSTKYNKARSLNIKLVPAAEAEKYVQRLLKDK